MGLPKRLPHIYQLFPICEIPINDVLADGIGKVFEDCNAILDDFLDPSRVKKVVPGETM